MSVRAWVSVRRTMGTLSDRRREEGPEGDCRAKAALQESNEILSCFLGDTST